MLYQPSLGVKVPAQSRDQLQVFPFQLRVFAAEKINTHDPLFTGYKQGAVNILDRITLFPLKHVLVCSTAVNVSTSAAQGKKKQKAKQKSASTNQTKLLKRIWCYKIPPFN